MSEYAKSSLFVAQYHLLQGGGDLFHAKSLMEAVAEGQSEEVSKAVDMLKKIKLESATKQRAAEFDAGSKTQSSVGDERGA